MLAVIEQADVVFFGLALLGSVLLLVAVFIVGIWIRRNQQATSPYTGIALRRGRDLPYGSSEKILRYLYDLHQYDNRIFDLTTATYCRETGRIFPKSLTWYGTIHVNWDFLKKRFPGRYVSWGSLTDVQKEAVRSVHDSLEGFQTEYSSSEPAPRAIEPEYAFAKPGPLYVDLESKILLGWKIVPGTNFEVLIVQHPKRHVY